MSTEHFPSNLFVAFFSLPWLVFHIHVVTTLLNAYFESSLSGHVSPLWYTFLKRLAILVALDSAVRSPLVSPWFSIPWVGGGGNLEFLSRL